MTRRKQQQQGGATDLFVVEPLDSFLHVKLLERLHQTGYRTVALTTIVYGTTASSMVPKPKPTYKDMTILRRLHVIVETVAEVGQLSLQLQQSSSVHQTFDLISIGPRTDAALQAVCGTDTPCAPDIVSLDPLRKIRVSTTLLQQLSDHGQVLEVPYASAIASATKKTRRTWIELWHTVQRSKSLQTKRRHLQNILLLSSGPRTVSSNTIDDDIGPLAIRRPNDIQNVVETVLQLPKKCWLDNTAAVALAVNHARIRTRTIGRTNTMVCSVRVIPREQQAAVNDKPPQDETQQQQEEENDVSKQKRNHPTTTHPSDDELLLLPKRQQMNDPSPPECDPDDDNERLLPLTNNKRQRLQHQTNKQAPPDSDPDDGFIAF